MGITDAISKIGVDAISGLFKSAGGFAKDVRAAITGQEVLGPEDKVKLVEAANALELALTDADSKVMQGQLEVNKLEAQGNWFQRGWRPFLGWTCGIGFFYQFIINPLLPWFVQVFSSNPSGIPALPNLDSATLLALTGGMLGLAGARTYEKVVDKKLSNGNGNGK